MVLNVVLFISVVVGAALLGWQPQADRTTWFMENAPIFIILPIVLYLHPKIKFTSLTLIVLTFHAFVLMVGGHYTYAEVPLGYWVKDAFELSRNHYDRLGHFMQGFGPAIAIRELLVKRSSIKSGFFRALVVISMCLGFSALYELIEWWSALILGQGADAFLGTQGDQWDTQWDMFLALVGALMAVTLFKPVQDAALRIQSQKNSPVRESATTPRRFPVKKD